MSSETVAKVTVFINPSERRCLEHATVLRIEGIECTVTEHQREYTLQVAAAQQALAEAVLSHYAEEQERSSARPVAPAKPPASRGWPSALVYAVVLCVLAWLDANAYLGLDWRTSGSASAEKIVRGEWWRTVTALGLHADMLHLAGNLIFGVVFGTIAARTLGSGLAWMLIVTAGAVGNAVNAVFSSPEHVSIGASTAVFAALGLIAMLRMRDHGARRVERVAPLVAAVVLLGTLGLGGARTDIGAHIAGFFSGMAFGACCVHLQHKARKRRGLQAGLGVATLALVCGAWLAAL